MRSRYIKPDAMDCVLMAMLPINRLVIKISLATGLRIGDVLALKSSVVDKDRITITEQKTGKKRRVTIPKHLRVEMAGVMGRVYVFEGRTNIYKHRTRQTVYKDIRRAATALRLGLGVSPHTARKCYAVRKYNACGDIKKVQKLLNHDDIAVTMIYAMADKIHNNQKSNS